MNFVCCKCQMIKDEIGGFSANYKTKSNGYFCKQCGNAMLAGYCLLPEYKTFLPNFSRPISFSQYKEEKHFVENQLIEFTKEKSDEIRREWNLLLKKFFPNRIGRFEK